MFRKQKRTSTNALLEAYDKLWQSGPTVKYQNPEGQVKSRIGSSIIP